MEDDVLVVMNGVPVVKRSDLEEEKKRLFMVHPQVKEALDRFDQSRAKDFDREILDGLVLEKIIHEYLRSHNITTSDEYQTELRYLCEDRRIALDAKYFTKRIAVTVSESEIKNFYETHKEDMLKVSDGEQKYIPYEQIRDRIKQRLEEIKRGEAGMKEIESLKKNTMLKLMKIW